MFSSVHSEPVFIFRLLSLRAAVGAQGPLVASKRRAPAAQLQAASAAAQRQAAAATQLERLVVREQQTRASSGGYPTSAPKLTPDQRVQVCCQFVAVLFWLAVTSRAVHYGRYIAVLVPTATT